MQKLINISGKQFYYSKINKVIESCSQMENCAIIIDENYLNEFVKTANDIIGTNINQIIIISESVNTVLSHLEGVSVLILAAENLKCAIEMAVLSGALSSSVVCVSTENFDSVKNIINSIERIDKISL